MGRKQDVVLSIAGLDPSSGAGCTADLKVFAAHGCYGLSCPTALTVQSTQGVRRSAAVDPALVREMLDCLADDFEIAGVKIGMLGTRGIVEAVAGWLDEYRVDGRAAWVVLDPVLRSSSGKDLLSADALPGLRERILPLVSIVTPNLEEAEALSGVPIADRRAVEDAALRLVRFLSRDRAAVVITGGHLEEAPEDYVLEAGGTSGVWIEGRRIETRSTHGTGCAFSSALLCALVRGEPIGRAVKAAKRYVEAALAAAFPVGKGIGPMHHLYHLRAEQLGD